MRFQADLIIDPSDREAFLTGIRMNREVTAAHDRTGGR